MTRPESVREAAVAGHFYPADPAELMSTLRDLFDRIPVSEAESSAVAIISPHAGYAYSGLTAAYAYNLIRGMSIPAVVIVSPSHREYFDGVSVYPGAGYRTPLGIVPVDAELRGLLVDRHSGITASVRGHRDEHALEVQLPFLQYVLKDFRILPIVMGDQRPELCTALGDALAALLQHSNALLIASSDLSHFHPSQTAEQLDRTVIRDIAAFDPVRLLADLDARRAEACGGGPMAAVLHAAKKLGATGTRILHHCNSGDITGDRESVVGYLSAVAVRRN